MSDGGVGRVVARGCVKTTPYLENFRPFSTVPRDFTMFRFFSSHTAPNLSFFSKIMSYTHDDSPRQEKGDR